MADLYLKGWLQVDIAAELQINQSTVSRDLRALHKQWLKEALVDYDKAKAKELAKIDRLEREYWVAWVRSCEDAEMVKEKTQNILQRQGESGELVALEYPDGTTKTRKGQAGDPRFLQGVQWCIERRCKILGVDAPEQMHMDVNGTGTLTIQLTGNISPDEL